jgi:hypothetical protein
MDPFQFVREVLEALGGLVAAVVLPIGLLWLIARRQRNRPRR